MSEPETQHPQDSTFGLSNVHFCPDCKKPLRRVKGIKGPFWGCSGFPDCRTTLNDVDGKPSREPDAHYLCPVCTRRMRRHQRKSKEWVWVCEGSKRGCDVVLPDQQGRPADAYRCRACGHLLRQRRGRHGMFWGCSSYPECTETYNDRDGKPAF